MDSYSKEAPLILISFNSSNFLNNKSLGEPKNISDVVFETC